MPKVGGSISGIVAQDSKMFTPQPASERRLFTVRPGGACSGSEVSVRYDGSRWAIPRGTAECDGGRSMQSLAITAQLLSLLQSAKDLPATSTVRIVGQ